eukprot:UN03990
MGITNLYFNHTKTHKPGYFSLSNGPWGAPPTLSTAQEIHKRLWMHPQRQLVRFFVPSDIEVSPGGPYLLKPVAFLSIDGVDSEMFNKRHRFVIILLFSAAVATCLVVLGLKKLKTILKRRQNAKNNEHLNPLLNYGHDPTMLNVNNGDVMKNFDQFLEQQDFTFEQDNILHHSGTVTPRGSVSL